MLDSLDFGGMGLMAMDQFWHRRESCSMFLASTVMFLLLVWRILSSTLNELQVFAWWVNSVLPAACHDLHCFPQDKRMFIQVLKYAPTDKPSQPYVSTSNEAFAILYFKGVNGNLRNWWNKKKAHLDKSLKLCDFDTYRKNNPGKGDHPKEVPNVRYVNHKTHGNKWTILNGGQQKNGSWKDAGNQVLQGMQGNGC
jgi:hypothetical protein